MKEKEFPRAKKIPGYLGYQISEEGKVKGLKGKWTRGSLHGYRIYKTNLRGVLGVKKFPIHYLVAEAFIPNLENLERIIHKDYNTHNNHASNLKWATEEEYRHTKRWYLSEHEQNPEDLERIIHKDSRI